MLAQYDAQAIVAERPWSDRMQSLIGVLFAAPILGLFFFWPVIFSGFWAGVLPLLIAVLAAVVLFSLAVYSALAPVALRIDIPARAYTEFRYLPPFRKVTTGRWEDFDRIVLRKFHYTPPDWWIVDLKGGVCGKDTYPLSSVNSRDIALRQAREIAVLLRLPLTDADGDAIPLCAEDKSDAQ